jgi:hypothetical protein
MRGVPGQQQNVTGLEHGEFLLVVFEIMQVQFAFKLIKDLVAGIDMKVLAPVRAARDKSNEVRILPDDPALAPVAAVLIDPLPQIELL